MLLAPMMIDSTGNSPPRRFLRIATALVLLLGIASSSAANEASLESEPTVADVEEIAGPIEKDAAEKEQQEEEDQEVKEEEEKQPEKQRARARRWLRENAPFLGDLRLNLRPRSYYFFDRDQQKDKREAWAAGGALDLRTSWWEGRLAAGATLFTSQRLVGKKSRDGTKLLKPGQNSFTVLGTSYARLRYARQEFTLYRQTLSYPYLNRQDNRMVPNTFEGYVYRGDMTPLPWIGRLRILGGWVTQMKERDSDHFRHISEVAGIENSRHGLALAGILAEPNENLNFGAINHFVKDTINIAYTEANFTWPITDTLGGRISGQFTHQRSVGDNSLTGSSFDTWMVGGVLTVSWRNATVRAAFNSIDKEARIRSPFGSYPGYVSMMQKNFRRAGEDAWSVGLSYDFRDVGAPGLSAVLRYSAGHGARDATTKSSLPDQNEVNLTLDYRLQGGTLKNLWFRFRGSSAKIQGERPRSNQVRLVVNYDFSVL